ncbi:MAG TPA: low-specificity L-threonine aldolase [Dehalococcoidia bacterium]|nr:low-specificity L-threonine aldolase [Dehalococcoidia bacterium]
MKVIDLRSDTVTHPTPAMREAMFRAEVGDDVLGDDPTVKRLEKMAAERMGKEAAVYVASGTMANLVSLLAHCQRGDEAIVGSESHILHHEVASAAGVGGIQLREVRNDEAGRVDADEVRRLIRSPDIHSPRTGLVCLENTHNRCGGAAVPQSVTAAVARVAREAGIPLHIDGARVFNAAIALETTPADLAREADSISFCLSKGLSAPIGSLVCGSGEFITRARKARKMLGGGMRQVGVIAAAGIVALEEMVDRLAEDHANARVLAEGLASIPGIKLDPASVQTNIVIFDLEGIERSALQQALRERGVLCTGVPPKVRMVTHYGIERADIEEALERTREAVASLS